MEVGRRKEEELPSSQITKSQVGNRYKKGSRKLGLMENGKCKMKENRNFLNFQLILLNYLTLFINLVIIH